MKVNQYIHIGTSGWHYGHWKGPFYPRKFKNENMLKYYSEFFSTVEINNSFYRLPDKETLIQWINTVPDGFIFSFKANRYITHMKKLKEPEKTLPKLLERVCFIKEKLGAILFQLPPRFKFNSQRLRTFLEALPGEYRYTFEFRDPAWINDESLGILSKYGASFCIYDFDGFLSPSRVTADFIYVRFHGPGGAYQGSYDDHFLGEWAGAFSHWVKQGKEVFCYFDNDEAGYAPQNALKLKNILGKG